MKVEVYSPPVQILEPITDGLIAQLNPVVKELAQRPRYAEPGRASWRTKIGADDGGDMLERVVYELSEQYLGRPPKQGSVAFLSVVTDSKLFQEQARLSKRASFWHQEVVDTPNGSMRAPGNRLNIAHAVGTLTAVGNLIFENAVKLPPGPLSRDAVLNAGDTVLSPDGSVIKALETPPGGEIIQAEGVFLLHPDTLHKATEDLPKGRIFLQMDAWE